VDANQSIGEVRLHGYMAVSGVDRSRCDFGHREFACEPHVPVRVVVGTARTSGVVTLEAGVTGWGRVCVGCDVSAAHGEGVGVGQPKSSSMRGWWHGWTACVDAGCHGRARPHRHRGRLRSRLLTVYGCP